MKYVEMFWVLKVRSLVGFRQSFFRLMFVVVGYEFVNCIQISVF